MDMKTQDKRIFLENYFKDSDFNIKSILIHLNDDWINAVYYTTSRGKREDYWNSIYEAYNANVLDKIMWDFVKKGSQEFKNDVDNAIYMNHQQ
jgi:hypothetical protein